MMRLSLLRRPVVAIGVLLLGASACSLETVGPSQQSNAPQAFLNSIVDEMEAASVRRHLIDWEQFRDTVLWRGRDAATIVDALPAAQLALTLLDDSHSWLRLPSGSFLSYPRSITCSAPIVPNLSGLPRDIGYLRVASFGGTAEQGIVYMQALQDAMRASDSPDLAGWIIDLRGNSGGNMWPMLASLWPFLQGTTGHFVSPDSFWTTWSVTGARALNGPYLMAEVADPYTPLGSTSRVAVLLDGRVASSGEATAIAFRGRSDTRFFGTPSCGLSTGIGGIPLTGGYLLGLARVTMADRDSTLYGGVVPPDETISDTDALVTRVIAWLRTGE